MRSGLRVFRGLLGSILSIAEALRLTCVMEGVETQAQLEALAEMNCEMAQGYHLGKPMTVGEINRLVEGRSHDLHGPPANGNGRLSSHRSAV